MAATPQNSAPPANVFRLYIDRKSLLPASRFITPEYVEFVDLPDDVQFSKSALFNDEAILGRSEPFKSYLSSSVAQITFTGRLVALGKADDGWQKIATKIIAGGLGLTGRFVGASMPYVGPAGKLASLALNAEKGYKDFMGEFGEDQARIATCTWDEVTKKARVLEALVYPQYDWRGHAYPPPLVRLQHGQNFTRPGVVKQVSMRWKGPWEVSTLLCMVVEAGIYFEEVSPRPKSFDEVQTGAGYYSSAVTDDMSIQTTQNKIQDNVRSISGL